MTTHILPGLMKSAAIQMQADLEEARLALTHNVSKGSALESVVMGFLRERLPESVGIASGQVIDSTGGHSKQMDIILYKASQTPMLFSTKSKAIQLIPAECVIGIVEVKTSVSNSDIDEIIANMKSVKDLDRTAYHPDNPSNAVRRTYAAHGRQAIASPIIYSLFAFESSDLESFSETLRVKQGAQAIDKRVDNACLLDKGVLINHINGEHIDAAPEPGAMLGSYPTVNGLLMWFLLNARYQLQAGMPHVNLLPYLGSGFVF